MTNDTAENPQGAAKTILMIDDDPFMRNIYGIRFAKEGFIIKEAVNGEEGLAKAREIKPDLILLDVLMPVLNGFETLQKLKADPELSSIPVIMLTTLGQKEDVDRGLKGGAVAYMVKTSTPPKDAVAIVRKALNQGT